MITHDHDPLNPKSHNSNPLPPSENSDFRIILPNRTSVNISLPYLQSLPKTQLSNCFIVSTGHGTSGPFSFTGIPLSDLIKTIWEASYKELEVISGDGFGNRVLASELDSHHSNNPILLAYKINNQQMTRQQGVVRMIVPTEVNDALRQVKWIDKIRIILD